MLKSLIDFAPGEKGRGRGLKSKRALGGLNSKGLTRKIPTPYSIQPDIREVKIPQFRFTGTSIAILFTNFLLMSAFLPVISTRFPAVNHGLHVKDKRVRVFSVYYLWAV
jgi:hypothetical protein